MVDIKKDGMEFNIGKSQYMELIRWEEKKIAEIEPFMQLGVLTDNKCLEDKNILLRIAKATNYTGCLTKVLNNREISKTKMCIESILRPTLIYACETCLMTNETKDRTLGK